MSLELKDAGTYIDLSLHECGQEECIPTKKFHFTVKKYHLVHYCIKGKGVYVLNNRTYHIKEGMMFYTPIGNEPIYYPNPDDPWTYIWLGFNGSIANELLDKLSLNENNAVYVDKKRLLVPYLKDIYAEYTKKGYLDMYCLGTAYEMFSTMLNNQAGKKEVKLSNREKYVQMTKEYIENNSSFDIKIGDISKNVGISSNYLTNIFSQEVGMSPKTYLINIRMEKAKLLLESGKYRIKEVSEMVGYSNQLHFSSEFRKKYDISPLEFLKGLNKNEKNN